MIQISTVEPSLSKPQENIEDYRLSICLGKGSMGKVKLGVHKQTGEQVAIKIVRRANFHVNGVGYGGRPKTKEQLVREREKEETREFRTIREAHIMMLLRHPHIVQLKCLIASGPNFYILMDYVEGGQLLHYIVKKSKLPEKDARQFSRQIVSALDYMHRNSIVHRDLKIENILIDKQGRNIKIIDFGLSNLFCPESRLTTYCGSLYFAAPELLCATPYRGPEIDIWSLGVVIYVMVTGSVPFDDKSMPGLHEKIKRGQVAYPVHISTKCKDLLSKIFVTDPTKRIILADIIRHDWMNQGHQRAIKPYLPPRLPLAPPLSPRILQHMTRGFGLGSLGDIQKKIELIVNSAIYRSAAEHVARIQHSFAHDSLELLSKRPYDDPQTIPAAYHPLLSIYHLVRERMELLEIAQESDSPVDGYTSEVTDSDEETLKDEDFQTYYPKHVPNNNESAESFNDDMESEEEEEEENQTAEEINAQEQVFEQKAPLDEESSEPNCNLPEKNKGFLCRSAAVFTKLLCTR